MKKIIYLLVLIHFSCKKNDTTTPKIDISQKPTQIDVLDINYGNPNHTNAQYSIHYIYNDLDNSIDSVLFIDKDNLQIAAYKFDYTNLANNHYININYTNPALVYYQMQVDSFYNRITNYKQYNTTANFDISFLYNSFNQLTKYQCKIAAVGFDFTINYTYSIYDTVFLNTQHNIPVCNNTDTIITSVYTLNKLLPFFLFYRQNPFLNCAEYNNAIPLLIKAMPISNNEYHLPYKATNGDVRTDYSYTYDDNDRMTQAKIISISKSTHDTLNVVQYDIAY